MCLLEYYVVYHVKPSDQLPNIIRHLLLQNLCFNCLILPYVVDFTQTGDM